MAEKKDNALEQRARRLLLPSRLPRIWVLSTLLSVVVGVAFGLVPLFDSIVDIPHEGGHPLSDWSAAVSSPGLLSSSHRLLEKNCAACHQTSFSGVEDEACSTCHKLTKHGVHKVEGTHKVASRNDEERSVTWLTKHEDPRPCVTCHNEHRGDAPISVADSRLCIDCHKDLQKVSPKTKLQNVTSIDAHPHFKVPLDEGLIKLNHAVHLKPGLRGPNGEETLRCNDCHHQAEADGAKSRTFAAIRYEKDCARCHPLSFDADLPDKVAPHGNPDEVVQYVFGEYAKLEVFGKREENFRGLEKLTYEAANRDSANSPGKNDLKQAVASALAAEKLIFTQTSCVLCHQIEQLPNVPENALSAHYSVRKPRGNEPWLKRALFDHSAHQAVSCTGCHAGVKESKESTDSLIPKLESCLNCHAKELKAGHGTNGLGSSCISCHNYHDPLDMEDEERRLLDYVSQKS